MLSSDMSWHHPVSSDRQLDPLHPDPFHQPQQAHPQQQPHQQPGADWDIFASPVEFGHAINPLNVNVPVQTGPISAREPSYDLFNTAPDTFGPSGRFRSDSSASSSNAYAPPTASPTAGSYDYLYSQNPVSSPSSAHPTRPSSASFSYPSAPHSGTISPDAVAPPSFAELMIDRQSSSGASSSTAADYSPFAAFQQPQQQGQRQQSTSGFQMPPYDLASPPQQYIQRPGLRHSAQSMPASAFSAASASPFTSGAFDPSAQLAASAPLVKREDVPFSFVPGAYNPQHSLQHDGDNLQSFIRYVSDLISPTSQYYFCLPGAFRTFYGSRRSSGTL